MLHYDDYVSKNHCWTDDKSLLDVLVTLVVVDVVISYVINLWIYSFSRHLFSQSLKFCFGYGEFLLTFVVVSVCLNELLSPNCHFLICDIY